jgi:hypothetical protein
MRWTRNLLNIRSASHSCIQAMENVPSIFRATDKITRCRNAIRNALYGIDPFLKRL